MAYAIDELTRARTACLMGRCTVHQMDAVLDVVISVLTQAALSADAPHIEDVQCPLIDAKVR